MKWTMSTRRRAEEFADVVDGVRPAEDASLASREFFAIVSHLRDVERPELRPEFAAHLRDRLMAAAPTALAELPPVSRARGKETPVAEDSWRTRGLRIATTTVLVFATAGGVAAASQSALPGDPLYQIKRSLEWIQVETAGSDQARGSELLDQATERLAEAERLAISRPDDPRTSTLIAGALDDFEQQATDGSDALVDDYRSDHDPASIVEVREFADDSSSQLDDLGGLVPPDAQDAVVDAAGVIMDIDDRARDTCSTCSALAPLDLSPTITGLSQTTQGVLDVLPGELGSATGGPDGGPEPPVQLPTLPAITGGGAGPGHGADGGGGSAPSAGGGHQTAGGSNGGGQQPHQPPLPTGGGVTTPPNLPLPSVPGVPLPPSIPLPSLPLPLPSLPLPTLLP